MAKTTTLQTSKAIYAAFPEWGDTFAYWYQNWMHEDKWEIQYMGGRNEQSIPAYDLAYLLDKLPAKITMIEGDIIELTIRKEDNIAPKGVRYLAYYAADIDSDVWCQIADNPTEAAGKLVLRLLERKWYSTTNVKQDDH